MSVLPPSASRKTGEDLLHWLGTFAAPIAWFSQLCVVYALAPLVCSLDNPLLLHVASLAAAAVAVAGGVLAYHGWESAGRGTATDTREGMAARVRFQSLVGLVLSHFFLLVIAANWLAAFLLTPCVP